LDLAQEQFALRLGLELDAVRNWECGRREPDVAAKSDLTVIERDPGAVQEALAVPVE
jgi:putative transcriptional regulator